MRTRLTELLGVEHPIIQGGLAHIATGAFAAAVAEAGAFAQITATSLPTPDDLAREVEAFRARSAKPFGINVAMGHRPVDAFLEAAIAARPTAISLTGGNPAPYIPRIKAAGILVLVLVASLRQAEKAEALGADAVIAVGQEGGGHIGRDDVGTLVLVRRVAQALRVPVVASGGVADGAGLLAALALGAAGVELGTRFLATVECPVHPRYKAALLEAGETETVVVGRSTGAPGRVLPGPWVDVIRRHEQEGGEAPLWTLMTAEHNRRGALAGDFERGFVWAGQGVGLIRDVPSVRDLVTRMVREAEAGWHDLAPVFGRAGSPEAAAR
ncbi:MAG: nitronate monooxygenase [Actinomycetia bacterium]|nr:nitronate monooxygenase [Actinomycetes bacterium]